MDGKKFLLFVGYHYYPEGGWNDFECFAETHEGAIEKMKSFIVFRNNHRYSPDWWQIINLETLEKEFGHYDDVEIL